MKKSTLFKDLRFSGCESSDFDTAESSLKLDFSKTESLGEIGTKRSNSKTQSMISIVLLFILFLFANFLSAQPCTPQSCGEPICLDGDPSDWAIALSASGGIKDRIIDKTDGTDDIWTGGSKDVQQISQWVWTTNSANDKNNMANVGYLLCGTKLYFFADRRANNGDSAIGFWILQGSVEKAGTTGGGFTGSHVDGDILMISHFVNGGAVAQIQAFRWTNGALDPTPIPLPTSGLDARVNITTVNAPLSWGYTPKSGAANTYPSESFFEGYIDLASVNFNLSVCLGTFLAETRNSQSLTASLEDLARGRFGSVPAPKTLVGSTFCTSSPNSGTITMASSENMISYQLKNNSNDSNVQAAQIGNGGTLTWSNLPAGSYYVVATNLESGCTSEMGRPTTVTTVQAPTVTVNSPTATCIGESVTVTATVDPPGTYTYVWTVPVTAVNPGNVSSFSTSIAGSYAVVVNNAANCPSNSTTGVVTVPTKVELTANGTNPLCFGGSGSITFSATGGTGTKTFTVNGNSATSPFSALASGTYTIVATDANGCTDTKQVTITIPTKVELTANGTNPLCFGGSGSITFSATGGTGDKTFTVNGNSATSPFSASASGTYTIVATDANGCTDTKQVTITIPTKVELTANGTNPLCFGGSGSITFSATGGTGNKTYTVNGNSATSPFSALASGTYTIVATDANGCTDTKQVTITIPTKVELTANGTNPLCFGGSGSITFSATGGTGDKTYTVNGNSATSPFSALASGTYTIVATDANGCTDTKQVTITIPTKVELTANGTNPLCFGGSGSITFSATGGTGNKTYTVNGNSATSPFSALASGTYTIVATDANGCTDTKQVTITIPTKVELTANGTNPLCFGGSGSITFSATGGTGDKTYTVNGNSATSPFSALASGTYTIVATDANGCTDTKQVTITIPTKVELTANGTNPLCFGGSGSITFSATGGTGDKTYTVNGNSATSPFSVSASGTYTIVATDANGCTDTKQVTITIPTKVELTANGTNPLCFGGSGSITFSATGGTGAKTFTVNGNAATSPFSASASGTYTIVATDANGCTDAKTVTITIPTKVELTANGTNPLCFGGSGSITFSATGGTGAKTFTVNGNAATSPFTASASGT
ncbi:hypothetical protein EZL74_11485, partial [Flavobacterium silvisoli]